MKRSYSFISVLLSLAILFGMQFIVSGDARAADLEFSNIKLEGDVLSWDPIPDLDSYYNLSLVDPNGRKFGSGFTHPAVDLAHDIDSHSDMAVGEYTVTLTASDKSGNNYMWAGKYNYDRILLNGIKDIKVDQESGYLTWSHDTSNVKGAKITYYIRVTVEDEEFDMETTDKKIPLMSFLHLGTHRYSIDIRPMADGCRSGDGGYLYQDITVDDGPVVEGLKIENDVLSWEPVEGADHYRVFYRFGLQGGGGHYSTKMVSGTSYEILPELTLYHAKAPYTIKYSVSAYKGDERITLGGNIEYEYEGKYCEVYPIYVNGIALTPNTDINDLIKGEGSVKYDPENNKLIFKDFVYTDTSKDYSTALFHPVRPLIIEGNATLNTNVTAIMSFTDVIFDEGSDITINSDMSCIYAEGVIVYGKLTVDCKQSSAIYCDDYIVIEKDALLKASSSDTGVVSGALYAEGGIELKDAKLIAPEGGKFAPSNFTVLDTNGRYAKKVILGNPSLMPTATPVPTATSAPTATPAAKATGKPTTAPTGKPDNNPTTKPNSDPTTVPAKDPKVQILDFVNRIYKYVLNREPEEEGVAFWSDELYAFRRTGAEVAQGFIFSPEFENRKTTDEEFVTILYKTFFGRDPEEEGMKFWLDQLKTGTMDRVTVANGFIYSQEWADTCASYGIRSGGDIKPTGNIEPTALTYAFVERMYTTAMVRTYDEEGRQYWASELANFNITGEQVGASFFLSDEMTNYKLDDREFLNRLYKTFMDREADEGGAEYWLGVMASGAQRSDIVFGFTRSEEFTNKCVEARILPY